MSRSRLPDGVDNAHNGETLSTISRYLPAHQIGAAQRAGEVFVDDDQLVGSPLVGGGEFTAGHQGGPDTAEKVVRFP